VPDVLEVLLRVIPVEAAALTDPDEGPPPSAHAALVAMLPPGIRVDHLPRFEFNAAVRSDSLALVIATGDQRTFANVLLTIGVCL
jgi:L-fucose mutarotase